MVKMVSLKKFAADKLEEKFVLGSVDVPSVPAADQGVTYPYVGGRLAVFSKLEIAV